MRPGVSTEVEVQSSPAPHERPWLFSLLIAPAAVISIGLVDGALSYLLRSQGVDPARGASIVALLSLPHTIYFLWGPVTDFFVRRRTWLMLAAAAAAATLLLAFHQSRLASTLDRRAPLFGRLLRRACRRRLRRHDGHAAQRNQSPPRRQLLPERLAGLRRHRRLCAGIALRPPSTRLSRLDRRRPDRIAVARRSGRARAVRDQRAHCPPNRRAHLARIQIHLPALGSHPLHAARHLSHVQRRHDRPAPGACPRLRRHRPASGVDQRRGRRIA